MTAPEKWTVEEWAAHYRQPVTTVRKLIRQHRIRAVNIGTQRRPIYRIPASEVDRYDRDNAA